MRDYYGIENNNPSGFVYANSTGTYAATAKHNFATIKAHETKEPFFEDILDSENVDRDLIRRRQAIMQPISIIDMLFIDPQEELPFIISRLKLLITKLKVKLTTFCKYNNLLVVIKMRDCFYNILYKLNELELRVKMPMILGIFMVQSLKKNLKRRTGWIKNFQLQQ